MYATRKFAWTGLVAAVALALFLSAAPLPAFPGRTGAPSGHASTNQTITSQAFMYIDAFYVDPTRMLPPNGLPKESLGPSRLSR